MTAISEAKFPIVCDDPEAFFAEMRQSASVYQLDRQDGQAVYIEMLVEAAGAVEQMFRTTGHYGVPVLRAAGFVSITALRQIVLRAATRHIPTRILVAGDLDPAGHDIRARVGEDITAFAKNHYAADITVQTVALTEPQVDELALIRAPLDAKKRKKYPWWPHAWTVELEAVSPEDLARIVVAAIENLTDAATRQAVIDRETRERGDLMRQLEGGER